MSGELPQRGWKLLSVQGTARGCKGSFDCVTTPLRGVVTSLRMTGLVKTTKAYEETSLGFAE